MSQVISIVGRSGSGKTTLIEKLCKALKSRGLKLATIKHTHHCLGADREGSDSYRHKAAGSTRTALSGPGFCSIWSDSALDPVKLARFLAQDCDLVLVEGFKKGPFPLVEVVRHREPMLTADQVWLTATDSSLGRGAEVPLSDIEPLLSKILGLVEAKSLLLEEFGPSPALQLA